jgi:hypothetical protein
VFLIENTEAKEMKCDNQTCEALKHLFEQNVSPELFTAFRLSILALRKELKMAEWKSFEFRSDLGCNILTGVVQDGPTDVYQTTVSVFTDDRQTVDVVANSISPNLKNRISRRYKGNHLLQLWHGVMQEKIAS